MFSAWCTDVGSWREGGGRGALQQQSQSDTDQPQLASQTSGGGDTASTDGLESPTARPPQAHPPLPPGAQQRPPHPMGPGMNPMMMRGMMPPYVSWSGSVVCKFIYWHCC